MSGSAAGYCADTTTAQPPQSIEMSLTQYSRLKGVISDIGHAAGSIDRATEQLDGATTALDQAAGTVTRLQESAAGNAAHLAECQRLVDESRRNIAEAKSIFADVDQANKSHGAQTGNH